MRLAWGGFPLAKAETAAGLMSKAAWLLYHHLLGGGYGLVAGLLQVAQHL